MHSEDVRFGDQSAFNVVMFEWPFRSPSGLKVLVLHPTEWPSGGVFFDYHDMVYGDGTETVFMVHNNFIIGSGKKVDRFKKHKMWLEDRQSKGLEYGNAGFKILGQSVPTLDMRSVLFDVDEEVNDQDYFDVYKNQPVLMYENTAIPVEERRERVIVSISTGGRKWFDKFALPRLKEYAKKTKSSILLIRRQTECDAWNDVVIQFWRNNPQTDDDEKDYLYHDCVKAGKVKVWKEALEQFNEVLYVDDTVLISRKAGDIFEEVGGKGLGVVGEVGVRR